VLCETVIVHLDPPDVSTAIRHLVAILAPDGTVCLTWRVAGGAASRYHDGRLYSPVDPATVTAELTSTAALLLDTEERSLSLDGTVHRLIARLPEAQRAATTPHSSHADRLSRGRGGDGVRLGGIDAGACRSPSAIR